MSNELANIIDHPGVFIQEELEARGWSQRDLAFVLGRPEPSINRILNGKASITPSTAKEFAEAFGVSAEFFVNLQRAYDLARADEPDPAVRHRARLLAQFPVREMIKRGWIEDVEPALLDIQMARFFEEAPLGEVPQIAHAAKKTDYAETTPIQLAWLYRVRQVARSIALGPYSQKALKAVLPQLKALMIEPDEVRHVPRLLEECGVRFVIVEALPGSKISGVTTWLSPEEPVIGMTTLYDRIDNFWFVLRHEIEHVLRRHGVDQAVIDEEDELDIDKKISEEETQANEASLEFCVPQSSLRSFVVRKAPYVSERDVRAFAKRMGVHPGIVVGQLQHPRNLNRWNFLARYKVKVREYLLTSALFDGWGEVAPVDL